MPCTMRNREATLPKFLPTFVSAMILVMSLSFSETNCIVDDDDDDDDDVEDGMLGEETCGCCFCLETLVENVLVDRVSL
jgi:hypothetical protein